MPESRRTFFKGAVLASAGASLASATLGSESDTSRTGSHRLPREVRLATISQQGISATTSEQMVARILEIMEEVVPSQPDCICLPETLNRMNVSQNVPIEQEVAERLGGIAAPFAEFAAKHHCYVVCPIHTRDKHRIYNSAILIDRNGAYVGEYRKSHTTPDEMRQHVAPGPTEVPVFETDFGKVGIQICFDIEWDAGWKRLQEQGAEVVFWPSAFAGGRMVSTRAWQHQYCVISSTAKDTSRVCDIDGTELATTSRWNPWAIATVNLEKAFLHTWPAVQRFPEILAKYGDRVRIVTHAEEEWSIIESRHEDLKVADLLQEFGLQMLRDQLIAAEAEQNRQRSSPEQP